MEQKRTLWVIAASGVFLLVVVGAAVILYSPSVSRTQAAQAAVNPKDGWSTPIAGSASQLTANPIATTTTAPVNPFDTGAAVAESSSNASYTEFGTPFDTGSAEPATDAGNGAVVSSSQNQQPLSTVQTSNVTVISDNTTVVGTGTTTIDLNALKSSSPSVTAQNATTQAQIAATQHAQEQRAAASTSTVAKAYEQPRQQSSAPKAQTSTSVAKAAPAKPAATTTKPASTAKPAATAAKSAPKATASAKASTAKVADKFWVQAASYSTKKSADNARATLESNKIPSEIFTYTDTKGTVFYRVRVGPYTTSSEAEYWKTQVAKIDQFASADSYIVNSSAKAVK